MKLRNGKTINETFIGYKMACEGRLVTLEIPASAKHNMNRTSVKDKQFAKHRCSEAIVKKIVDLATGEQLSVAFSLHDKTFQYILGQRVVPTQFHPDLELVCGGGIHYFLDEQLAVLHGQFRLHNGEYKSWYDNGQLECLSFYKDGKLDGEYIRWFDNGQMDYRCFYKDGKPCTEFKAWYENGQIRLHYSYKDGKVNGEYKAWYDNGQLCLHQYYIEGKRNGEVKDWDSNGQLIKHCFYKAGKLDGECRNWDSNGQLTT